MSRCLNIPVGHRNRFAEISLNLRRGGGGRIEGWPAGTGIGGRGEGLIVASLTVVMFRDATPTACDPRGREWLAGCTRVFRSGSKMRPTPPALIVDLLGEG